MEANPPHKSTRVVALSVEEQLKGVHKDGDELHHLNDRYVALPRREITRHLWSHSRDSVVHVQNDVNEGVYECKESAVSTCKEYKPGLRQLKQVVCFPYLV